MSLAILQAIDALLITNPVNIRYLTGFVGVAPGERESYLLTTSNQAFLFTNSLYLEQARQLPHKLRLTNYDLRIMEISRDNPISKKLVRLVTDRGLTGLGFEESDLTVAEYQKLKKALKGVNLIPTRDRIEKLRMIKRADEIENIKEAARFTDECFNFILGKLKPEVTEGEIAWEIEDFFRKRGATAAFSPVVAFGKNTSQPHYNTTASSSGSDLRKPQGQTLRQSDIVLLDFGARVNGYCSDMTRVVFIGKPKDEWRRAYETVLEAQKRALDYISKNGSPSGAAADRLCRKIIKEAGFPIYPHSLGHNVGLDIHEGPRLTVKKDVVLKPGMVVTIEPAIYVEESYGIRIEDLVVLNKEGIEQLSQSKKEMVIL